MALRSYKAGFATTDTPGDIVFLTNSGQLGATFYDCFQQNGVNYQVPVGKTLYITRILLTGGAANSVRSIGYADTGVTLTSTPPTAFVTVARQLDVATASNTTPLDVFMTIPAQK